LQAERREAIEQLFVRHSAGIGSYLLARVGDAELAEEITARVFHTVVRRIGQCRGLEEMGTGTSPPGEPAASRDAGSEPAPVSSVVGWLWAIVRSELARHFRDRRRSEPLSEELPDRRDPPGESAARDEMHRRMQTALEQLDDEEQRIIAMKFFLRARNTEIAEALGQTPNNVGVKIHRTVRHLRELMHGL